MNRPIHKLTLTGLFLLGFLSLQCRDHGTAPVQGPTGVDLRQVIPLQIGNSWTFRKIDYSTGACDTTLDSLLIVDTLWQAGQKCYRYQGFAPHLPGFQTHGYIESINGGDYWMNYCYLCVSGGNAPTPADTSGWLPLYLLRCPLRAGHQWRIADWDSAAGENFGTVTITNPDTSIDLEGRDFDHVISLTYTAPFTHVRFMIAPGIGVVYQFIGGAPDSWTEKRLIAWNVRQ